MQQSCTLSPTWSLACLVMKPKRSTASMPPDWCFISSKTCVSVMRPAMMEETTVGLAKDAVWQLSRGSWSIALKREATTQSCTPRGRWPSTRLLSSCSSAAPLAAARSSPAAAPNDASAPAPLPSCRADAATCLAASMVWLVSARLAAAPDGCAGSDGSAWRRSSTAAGGASDADLRSSCRAARRPVCMQFLAALVRKQLRRMRLAGTQRFHLINSPSGCPGCCQWTHGSTPLGCCCRYWSGWTSDCIAGWQGILLPLSAAHAACGMLRQVKCKQCMQLKQEGHRRHSYSVVTCQARSCCRACRRTCLRTACHRADQQRPLCSKQRDHVLLARQLQLSRPCSVRLHLIGDLQGSQSHAQLLQVRFVEGWHPANAADQRLLLLQDVCHHCRDRPAEAVRRCCLCRRCCAAVAAPRQFPLHVCRSVQPEQRVTIRWPGRLPTPMHRRAGSLILCD